MILLILRFSKISRTVRRYGKILSYALCGAVSLGFLCFIFSMSYGLFSYSKNIEEPPTLSFAADLPGSQNLISPPSTNHNEGRGHLSPVVWIGAYIGFFLGWAIGWNKRRRKYVRVYRR